MPSPSVRVEMAKEMRNEEEEEDEYHQLVHDSQLFFHKLNSFHPNFISPSIGGTTLDLHRLFVEVTSRGGLNQVIRERKWEEVVSAFSTGITNFKRSFLLRKYYLSLLYNFEQAYFLKMKAPPAAVTDVATQNTNVGLNKEFPSNCNEEPIAVSHLQGSIQIQPGITLIGVIDEKLDNGYVVSVNVGTDTLKGVLYHIPEKPQGPQPCGISSPSLPRRRKRKKSHLSLMKYNALNPIPQGQENSNSNTGQTWNQLSEPEKQFHDDSNAVMASESNHAEVVHAAINS